MLPAPTADQQNGVTQRAGCELSHLCVHYGVLGGGGNPLTARGASSRGSLLALTSLHTRMHVIFYQLEFMPVTYDSNSDKTVIGTAHFYGCISAI